MKKIIIAFLSLVLLAVCLMSVTSCSNEINAPGNFVLDEDTLVLSWDRVLGAKSYTTLISGQEYEKSTKDNKLDLEDLDPGFYEIKVKANGDGIETDDSDWAVYPFERKPESGLKYKLINGNREYELVGIGSASGDIVMDDEYRGKPVTSIAEKAFAGNNRVTSFKVGKNVKTIGSSAFSRCAELVSFTFDEECVVTEIGDRCFQSCKKLESFVFPETITSIPQYIFSYCSALNSVSMGDNVDTIGTYAFASCEGLEKIDLPNKVTLIGEYAFSNCKGLVELDVGDAVETIQDYSFYNCVKLKKVDLGESLKTIKYYAFGNCEELEEITIPNSCETIEQEAFRYCEALENVTLGDKLSFIGAGAFFNTKLYGHSDKEKEDYKRDVIIGGWYIYCKDKEITEIDIPDGIYGIADSAFYMCKTLEELKVTGIKYVGDSAFWGCEALHTVIFDNSLVSIGAYSFKACKVLKNVKLGTSLQTIGDYAFSTCEVLKDIDIILPNTVVSIGSGAFKGIIYTVPGDVHYVSGWAVESNVASVPGTQSGYTSLVIKAGTRGIANYAFNKVAVLSAIVMPDSVEYIGRGAFYQCATYEMISVSMPKNLKKIGDYAFYGCYTAAFDTNNVLNIPNGTEYIGRSAFYGCESVLTLNIPGSVKEIGMYAFYGCRNIGATVGEGDSAVVGSITLGEGIKVIKDRAFQNCSSIVNLVIPDSVESIGVRAFYKCEGIKSLTLGNGIAVIPDYAFYNCAALESLTVKNGTVKIGRYAFRGCAALTSLELGDTVTEIGDFAFYGAAKLETLALPSSLTSIGKHAFRGMTAVKSIIIPASVQTIGAHAFYGAVGAAIYCEATEIPNGWIPSWNSSYAPAVMGCTLSEDKSYPVSFTKTVKNPENMHEIDDFPTPVREGYTFGGFATTQGGGKEYDLTTLRDVSSDTVLYFIWQ